MGDCYATSLRAKFKKNGEENAVKALKKYIKENDGDKVNFSLDEYRAKRNIVPNSFENIVRIFFADWRGNNFVNGEYRKSKNGKMRLYKHDEQGYRVFQSGFDASYGWGTQLYKFAELIAPFLEDGSYMSVDSDETNFTMEVTDGEGVFDD